jgi:hypothetical protein
MISLLTKRRSRRRSTHRRMRRCVVELLCTASLVDSRHEVSALARNLQMRSTTLMSHSPFPTTDGSDEVGKGAEWRAPCISQHLLSRVCGTHGHSTVESRQLFSAHFRKSFLLGSRQGKKLNGSWHPNHPVCPGAHRLCLSSAFLVVRVGELPPNPNNNAPPSQARGAAASEKSTETDDS